MPSPSSLGRRLLRKARAAGFGSRLYAYTLKRPVPEGLSLAPEDIWPGEAAAGNALFQGRFAFAGAEVVAPGEAPWGRQAPSADWAAELHGFAWLRDLSACAVPTAQRFARELVRTWIAEAGAWDEVSWRPEVLGRRLLSWLCHAGFFLDGADDAFRAAFLASLGEQSLHLSRTAAQGEDGAPRLAAVAALSVCGLCLEGAGRKGGRGLGHVERELSRQILAGGVHASRNPSAQLAVLRDLVVLRDCVLAAEREVPESLDHALQTMAPMLRFFRHGDGGLALFNGAVEESAERIDITLARAGARGKPPPDAPESGYCRLGARRTVVLADCGAPPPESLSGEAHAGTASFELSQAKERLIVNCGAGRGLGPDWALAGRFTAAHSTLAVADTNSSEFTAEGRVGRRPRRVSLAREEQGGNLWLETSHDGYAEPYGLVHRRRLYLDASGDDLRGEDVVTGGSQGASARLPIALRFHLHPEVRASLEENGAAVLLKPPSGKGWRLRAAGGELSLEESIYLGQGTPRRAEQVVVSARLEGGEATLKWAISRL